MMDLAQTEVQGEVQAWKISLITTPSHIFHNPDELDDSPLFRQIPFSSLSILASVFPSPPVRWTPTHTSRPMSNASSTDLSIRCRDITPLRNCQSILFASINWHFFFFYTIVVFCLLLSEAGSRKAACFNIVLSM